MDVNKLVKVIAAHPAIVGRLVDTDPAKREAVIRDAVGFIVKDIAVQHDWDFNTDFIDMTSVLDQAVYECEGNKDDCRDIITIQYGLTTDNLATLLERTPVDRDDYVNTLGVSDVTFWSPYKRSSNDYPRFELVAAPSAAGSVIRVRYRVKDIGIGSFPSDFEPLLMWATMASLLPEYEPMYKERLGQMVVRHQGAGREDKRLPLDPIIEQGNLDRSSLSGY